MSKDDSTWLRVAYLCLIGIVALLFVQATDSIGDQTGWSEGYSTLWQWPRYALALLIGFIVGWAFWRKKDRHEYFLAAVGELRKITWPAVDATRQMTIIVVVVCVIFSLLLAAMDSIAGFGLDGIQSAVKWILGQAV